MVSLAKHSGSAVEIELHRAHSEDLCEPCRRYLIKLRAEGFGANVRYAATPHTDIVLSLPSPSVWRLSEIAESRGEDLETMLATVVLSVLAPRVGQARRLPSVIDGQIRGLHANGFSNVKIAEELGITRKAVSDRLDRWGLAPNGKGDTRGKRHGDHRG